MTSNASYKTKLDELMENAKDKNILAEYEKN
jgi:hypothetical protein